MKITVSIRMDGNDQWTEEENDYGHGVILDHTETVVFDDSICQLEMISSVLKRLIRATRPPRYNLIVAKMVDDEGCDTSKNFQDAAEELIEYWRDHDESMVKS